jgi:hypothetical protein
MTRRGQRIFGPDCAALPATAPPHLQQQLHAAFDIQALYKKNTHQVTIHATITSTTARTVAAIINAVGDHPATASPDTSTPEPVFSDMAQTSIARASYYDHEKASVLGVRIGAWPPRLTGHE